MNSNIKNLIIYFLLAIDFLLIVAFFLKKYTKLSRNKKTLIMTLIVILTFILLLIYTLHFNNWIITEEFVLNVIVVISFITLTYILRLEYINIKEINNKYEILEDYLETSALLLEKYSTNVHKYKNNLIAIKGYMKGDLNDANKYIDKLLDSYKTKKYKWVKDVNYIQIETIKHLIYYKLSKAEDMNLNISVNISKELKKTKNLKLNFENNNILMEVLGEYFDNAIIASLESMKKELVFNVYIENNFLVFVLANTFKDTVELNKLGGKGYTTKGKGHGNGLYQVSKELSKNKDINYKYELIDDYFSVILKVNYNSNIFL